MTDTGNMTFERVALTPEQQAVHDALQVQYRKIDSGATLEVRGMEFGLDEPHAYQQALARAAQYLLRGSSVILTLQAPRRDGMLDWGMQVTYRNGGGIYLGCIVRDHATDMEFHS